MGGGGWRGGLKMGGGGRMKIEGVVERWGGGRTRFEGR